MKVKHFIIIAAAIFIYGIADESFNYGYETGHEAGTLSGKMELFKYSNGALIALPDAPLQDYFDVINGKRGTILLEPNRTFYIAGPLTIKGNLIGDGNHLIFPSRDLNEGTEPKP